MLKVKGILFKIGVALWVIHTVLLVFYRPYIYENDIYDFHFADTIGSLFCIPVSTFIIFGYKRVRWSFYTTIGGAYIANIFYECSSLFFVKHKIDIPDLIAIHIGFFITLLIYILLCSFRVRDKFSV